MKYYLKGKDLEKISEEFIDKIKEAEEYFRELSYKMAEIRSKYEVDFIANDLRKLTKNKKIVEISTSWLQRKYGIGYAHSAMIIDGLEARKLVKMTSPSSYKLL